MRIEEKIVVYLLVGFLAVVAYSIVVPMVDGFRPWLPPCDVIGGTGFCYHR